ALHRGSPPGTAYRPRAGPPRVRCAGCLFFRSVGRPPDNRSRFTNVTHGKEDVMNAKGRTPARRANRPARSRGVPPSPRELCRAVALDPQQVRAKFPNVAALIDELVPG